MHGDKVTYTVPLEQYQELFKASLISLVKSELIWSKSFISHSKVV